MHITPLSICAFYSLISVHLTSLPLMPLSLASQGLLPGSESIPRRAGGGQGVTTGMPGKPPKAGVGSGAMAMGGHPGGVSRRPEPWRLCVFGSQSQIMLRLCSRRVCISRIRFRNPSYPLPRTHIVRSTLIAKPCAPGPPAGLPPSARTSPADAVRRRAAGRVGVRQRGCGQACHVDTAGRPVSGAVGRNHGFLIPSSA